MRWKANEMVQARWHWRYALTVNAPPVCMPMDSLSFGETGSFESPDATFELGGKLG